jgi:hypothetical protein
MNFFRRCLAIYNKSPVRSQSLQHIKCSLLFDERSSAIGKAHFTTCRYFNQKISQTIILKKHHSFQSHLDSSIFRRILSPKQHSLHSASSMTNKPRCMSSSTKSCNVTGVDHLRANAQGQPCNNYSTYKNLTDDPIPQTQPFSLTNNVNFKTMANVQKLAIEPTREHIENIRQILKHRNAKDNADQEITLEKDHDSGIGVIRIKSAAKNGISAKMMCDFLDIIDELYSWPQGKGVLIYGHNGFFCSGG